MIIPDFLFWLPGTLVLVRVSEMIDLTSVFLLVLRLAGYYTREAGTLRSGNRYLSFSVSHPTLPNLPTTAVIRYSVQASGVHRHRHRYLRSTLSVAEIWEQSQPPGPIFPTYPGQGHRRREMKLKLCFLGSEGSTSPSSRADSNPRKEVESGEPSSV